jgi:hypothetical protein
MLMTTILHIIRVLAVLVVVVMTGGIPWFQGIIAAIIYREQLIETVNREVARAQNKLLRERFERMAVYAEYRVYWHSDTKPC